jgi:phosphotransferase system  glucose/maltose/N-acetylglucosamine-specific IIC component
LRNEDRELQIELTRLQVKHEHEISSYTIAISVVMSIAITNVAIYLPLGLQTGNDLYIIAGVVYALLIIPVFSYLYKRMRKVEAQLEEDIRKLKEKYLW